jgi:hypothetical protein
MVVGTVVTMRHRGIPFDLFTYISALRASSVGRRLHGLVVHNMFQSRTSVMNVLVDMYFRAGRPPSLPLVRFNARTLFRGAR